MGTAFFIVQRDIFRYGAFAFRILGKRFVDGPVRHDGADETKQLYHRKEGSAKSPFKHDVGMINSGFPILPGATV